MTEVVASDVGGAVPAVFPVWEMNERTLRSGGRERRSSMDMVFGGFRVWWVNLVFRRYGFKWV